jgi:hypothetical protein
VPASISYSGVTSLLNTLLSCCPLPHSACCVSNLAAARELFSDFFVSLFGYPLSQLLADSPAPAAAQLLYSQMMRDILGGGGSEEPLAQVRQGEEASRGGFCRNSAT